jgi:hypothetical protein
MMEPERSLLSSQEPATGPCPEPDESSPQTRTPPYISKIQCNIVLSSTSMGLPNNLLLQNFLSKPCTHLSALIHATCSAHLILLDLTTSKSYDALHNAVFFSLLLCYPS